MVGEIIMYTDKDGNILSLAELQALFFNTSFPANGPNEQWLSLHGFSKLELTMEA